ncbi:unnamed protein product [Trichobilharzia regenti]|nr:unnamed protein product [Trichobilharzia regenti]
MDLPPNIPYEFRDTFNLLKQESEQLSPPDNNRTENEIHSIIELSQQQLKEDLEYSPSSQKKFNSVKMKSNLNWSKTEEKLLDSINTRRFKANTVYPPIESNKINNNNKSSIELTPNTFNSVKDFTGYWLPIQGRIHDKCLTLMKVLHQSKLYSSTCSITSLFSQMDNEFIILSQLCTIMIGLSKQSSLDNGLTRKFIIYRQNMENLAEIFIKISKNCNANFDSQYQNKQASQSTGRQIKRDNCVSIKKNSNNEGDYNGILGDNYEDGDDKNLLEQTIQELLTEVNLFYTTILANSRILFSNSINKSPEIIRKISSPVEEVETKAIPKLSTPVPSLLPPITPSSQSHLDNRKFLSKSHEFIDTLSPNSTTSQQTDFTKLQKYQNADFQKLSQLCLNALKIIDEYLNYLMQFQTDNHTGYSFSHKSCRRSLSIHSIVGQTKLVMQSCSELVRCTTSICNEKNVSPSQILTSSCQGDDIFSRCDSSTPTMNTNSSGKKLEYMADQVCEALKGLVTQTKETAKFITNDFENLPTDKVIPIPGPLLQRLNGALKSVQNSIETINKWVTSEYCQKKGNLKYLSSTHI